MKNILYIFAIFAIFACEPPTASNSDFAEEITQLDNAYSVVDSNYTVFQNNNLDTLSGLRSKVNERYNKIKETYTYEGIDTSYEKLMLIARGQFTKKLANIGEISSRIIKEYTYSSEQYKSLRKNLIHENLEKEDALVYYHEEKNALVLLNAEIVNFNESVKNTVTLADEIIPQMDSIIKVYATTPE